MFDIVSSWNKSQERFRRLFGRRKIRHDPLSESVKSVKRQIEYIVIHHSASTSDSLDVIEREHKRKFEGQDRSDTEYPSIAYHYIIMQNGKLVRTRALADVGWHAGNWEVNRLGVGICLLGNFEHQKPTRQQINTLERTTKALLRKFRGAKIVTHKEVRKGPTLCPGRFLTPYVQDLRAEIASLRAKARARATLSS